MLPVTDKHKAETALPSLVKTIAQNTGRAFSKPVATQASSRGHGRAVRLFCHAKGVLADGNEKKWGKVARSGGKLVTLKSKYT